MIIYDIMCGKQHYYSGLKALRTIPILGIMIPKTVCHGGDLVSQWFYPRYGPRHELLYSDAVRVVLQRNVPARLGRRPSYAGLVVGLFLDEVVQLPIIRVNVPYDHLVAEFAKDNEGLG